MCSTNDKNNKRNWRIFLRKFSLFLFFFLLLFFCAHPLIAADPDWVYFDFNLAKDFLYVDKANIAYPYPDYDIIRVIQKTIYKNRTINISADRLGNTYNDLRESIETIDIYCSKRKYLSRSITFYDSRGGIIEKTDNFESHYWVSIPPNTSLETLFKMICTKPPKQ